MEDGGECTRGEEALALRASKETTREKSFSANWERELCLAFAEKTHFITYISQTEERMIRPLHITTCCRLSDGF